MPFELGIDFGLRKFNKEYKDKKTLILETEKYDYMRAISDINGFDIKNHSDTPLQLIKCIRSWFSETVSIANMITSNKVYSDFIDFNTELFLVKTNKYLGEHNSTEAEKFAKQEIEEMTIPEYILEIERWKTKR